MRRRKWTIALAASIAVVLAAGCGGDDTTGSASGGTVSSSSISKAAFIKQGDAICEAGRKRLAAAGESIVTSPPREREALARELIPTVLVPVLKADIAGLRDLGAPRGDEEEVEAILEGFEEILERAEAEPQLFLTAGGQGAADPWRATDKRAEEYGFTECPRS